MCSPTLRHLIFLFFGFLVPALSPVVRAYVFEGPRWPSNTTVVMHLEFGSTNRTLSDGFATWDDSAADALGLWNQNLGDGVQFQPVVGSAAPVADGNGINTASYRTDIYGQAFGSDVLAVTVLSSTGDEDTTFIEADVLFNSARKWDSYRGVLRQDPVTRQPLIDFHRVAIHEFGHVLGLDHPDEHNQTVRSIMNSSIGNVDTLQTDDIAGVRSIYRPYGRLVRTFPFKAGRLLADPVRPLLYATLPSDNALAVINTDTLEVLANFYIGSNPVALALSPAGDRLYVANNGSTVGNVGIVDLETLTPMTSLSVPSRVNDIAVGLDDRLYVLGGESPHIAISQVDATTGVVQGNFGYPIVFDSFGFLQISPDRRTLYYADGNSSPSALARFDVSTPSINLLQRNNFANTGSNGESLTISHNGQFLCFPNGSGNNNGYGTTLIPADDVNGVYGTFQTGAYPRQVAFSPDDALLYEAGNGAKGIQIFDTRTFNPVDSFFPSDRTGATVGDSDSTTSMAVTSGVAGYLFVASTVYDGSLRVFSAASNPPRPPRETPTVSVVAAPARGGFVVSRTGDVSRALKVHLHTGGAAVSGTDYVALKGKLKLPAGQSEAVVPVALLPGANRSRKVKVFLDPAAQGEYAIGKAQAKMVLSALP